MEYDYGWLTRTERQQRWRQSSGRVQLNLSLEPEILAILDAIAIDLYEKNPHQPPDRLSQTVPNRAEAVRELARRYAVAREQRNRPIPGDMLIKMREALGRFWKKEAVWRRNKTGVASATGKAKKAPKPPWR